MATEAGYAGKILRVDLSSGRITDFPTRDYADRFVGGRGIAAKIYWDEVSPDINALAPENQLIFVTGPLAGFPGLSGSRWQVCGKSPSTEQFSYSSAGGSWGAWLKFSGYDGIVIQGKSDKPVCLFLQDGTAEIKDASALWGKGSIETRDILKGEFGSNVRVVAIGPAGENMVTFATLLADEDSSLGSGFGAVAGSKKLKAIAVTGKKKAKAANPERLRELTRHLHKLVRTSRPRQVAHSAPPWAQNKQICYGCTAGCHRSWFEAQGRKGKFQCQSSAVYLLQAFGYYQGTETNPIEVGFLANKLCDEYGLDTMFVQPILIWMQLCNQAGILTDENTGMPLSKFGSLEFIKVVLRKIALRDGFGDVLAQGILKASDLVGSGTRELITDYICNKAGHLTLYDTRIYMTTGLLYATEPRQPIQQLHEASWPVLYWLRWVDRWEDAFLSSEVIRALAKSVWGSEFAADFSTYEGKALAAKKIQDYTYAKESLILCDFLWPMTYATYSDDGVGALESKILSAVTGKEIDKEEFYRIGEKIFNLQRAILVRQRHKGKESDEILDFYYTMPLPAIPAGIRFNPECLVPGKGGLIISKKGEVIDRKRFEKMKDEYYQLRGWDVASGLQTKAKLKELGLQDIMGELEQQELIV